MDLKGGILCQRAQSDGSWTVVMDLSRQSRRKISSSIATILKEWNLIALMKGRKWNLRRVRDEMVVPQQLR
jgi:hypothetical protein